jgi:Holliday junction resolvase RusA-like endonuclease
MFEANKGHKNYRALVTYEVRNQMEHLELEPFNKDDALILGLTFYMPKPKSVTRQYPTVKPDGDKLARSVSDSIVASGLVPDDSQFVEYHVYKQYGELPCVIITIRKKPPILNT